MLSLGLQIVLLFILVLFNRHARPMRQALSHETASLFTRMGCHDTFIESLLVLNLLLSELFTKLARNRKLLLV